MRTVALSGRWRVGKRAECLLDDDENLFALLKEEL